MTTRRPYAYFLTFLLIGLMILSGCSRKKSTFTSRLYHNTTSLYNWYFNANEIVKETERQLWLNNQDDFLELLPVYLVLTDEERKNLAPSMDEVIEKCSTVIDRHSMKIKKKEHNKWIDDCYLLLGVANYYKGNFSRAEEMFSYVSKKYKSEDSRFDAALWLARTYTEQEKFGKANTVLTAIEKDNGKDRPKSFTGDLERAIAFNYLQQARYQDALPHLEDASRLISDKQMKARMTYITAQTFKLENRSQNAIDYFQQVVRMKPDYEMEFYAKISQALAFDRKLDSSKIKAMLREMARAKQYETFRDQIFYALAEIELEEENIEEGKRLLTKSADLSVNNPKQKGKSYLRLADIYFIDREYLIAKNYYDSTAVFLPEDYPDYHRILAKASALDDLVLNLQTIETNDSLLALANMDEKERDKKIMRVIVELEAEAERKMLEQQRALERAESGALQASGPRGGAGGSGKDWYFYNPNTLGVGYQEFQRNWGRRKLEDNWRRSNKRESIAVDAKPGAPIDSISGAIADDTEPKTLEDFLATLPLTDSSQTALHNEIIHALYNMGTIYKESLFDPDNAIESFLRIANDYDTSATAPSAYYQLYRIYYQKEQQGGFVGTGFRDNSDYYKDIILSDFPNSEYAKLILDPDYVTDRNRNFLEEKLAYEETYKKFSRRQYTDVLLTCNAVIRDEPNNNFLSKYYLIKALSISAKNDADSFEAILREIVTKFPNTEEGAKAAELLGALNEAKAKMARDAKKEELADKAPDPTGQTGATDPAPATANTSMFAMDAGAEHFFALIFPKEGVAATELKENISDFNQQKFAGENLRITNSFIDKDRQIIIVRSFGDKAKAMSYYNAFFTDQGFLKRINDENYQRFTITTKNFTVLFRNKNPEDYGVFFSENYL